MFPRNPFRHQLPSFSPVPARALARAAALLLRGGKDPKSMLSRRLLAEHGGCEAILLGSGTQALALALAVAERMALGVKAERSLTSRGLRATVALPAYSCFDVATATVAGSCRVSFYDVDPRTLSPDLESFERALDRGARIAVVGPLFGIPLEWAPLIGLAEDRGALIVEDAAQAHGIAELTGGARRRPLFRVLSFGRGKGWTGTGAGGALILGSLEAAELARRLLGWTDSSVEERRWSGGGSSALAVARGSGLWALARPSVYRIPAALPGLRLGETRYRSPGPTVPMPRAAAAILLAAAEVAERETRVRRHHAVGYQARLFRRGLATLLVAPSDGAAPGYLRFPVLPFDGLGSFGDPDEARRLGAAPGYPCALPHLLPLASFIEEGEARRAWPGARELVERLVTLPTHSRTRPSERDALVDAIDARPVRRLASVPVPSRGQPAPLTGAETDALGP